jgi:hypothetical protein
MCTSREDSLALTRAVRARDKGRALLHMEALLHHLTAACTSIYRCDGITDWPIFGTPVEEDVWQELEYTLSGEREQLHGVCNVLELAIVFRTLSKKMRMLL